MRLRGLGNSAVRLMFLLGAIGVGLWLLTFISRISSGTPVSAVGSIATRYKQFATTGT